MFVCSVKSPKSKIIGVVLAILLALLGFIVWSQLDHGADKTESEITTDEPEYAQTDNEVCFDAADGSERLQFITQFGWTVRDDPAEIAEVLIPAEFDEVYKKYNALQQSQGLDLESYRGERVKRWSYVVTNYPGYEDADFIRINLLICKGVVVGGDVCSLAEDGFMHGFAKTES